MVLLNTSQVKFKKTEVEDHPRISRISNQTKSVTACNDSLNSRTLNVNAVCATCGKLPISTRKPKSQENKSVATPYKKTVASDSNTTNYLEVAFWKSTCFLRDLQGNDLLTAWLWHRRLSHLNFDYINLLSKKNVVIGLPKLKYVNDQLRSSCEVATINGKKYILEGIEHQTSTPRTPEQNNVVKRRNRTLVEAARMMLSASKLPLF
ncbi:retrovirus-related pol polyprotein from transposon TNT 1-94, partial [Tanacetum coccineum]